jgi:hypothetical protein
LLLLLLQQLLYAVNAFLFFNRRYVSKSDGNNQSRSFLFKVLAVFISSKDIKYSPRDQPPIRLALSPGSKAAGT